MRTVAHALLLAGAIGALGQPKPRFTSRVEAVTVTVLVSHRGQPVKGLAPSDFELRDNGVLQKVERVDNSVAPLDVLLVLDTSSSVGRDETLARLAEAATAAVRVLRPGDRAALVSFSHHVQVRSALTSDHASIETGIRSLQASGATSLSDAIIATLLSTAIQPEHRTLVIAYTDGVDTMSWHNPEDAITTAARTDAVVYAVASRHEPQLRASLRLGKYPSMSRFLVDLTSSTGGLFLAVENDRLAQTFGRIVEEYSHAYLLVYYPQGAKSLGWHSLAVRLKHTRGEVRGRRGYYAE